MVFDDVQKLGFRSCEIGFENELLEYKTPEGVVSRFIYELIDLHVIESGGNLSSDLSSESQGVDFFLAFPMSTPDVRTERLKSLEANVLARRFFACVEVEQGTTLKVRTSFFPYDLHSTQALNFRFTASVGQMLNLRFDRLVGFVARCADLRDVDHAIKDRDVLGG